jgi:hypothetical protein
MTENVCHAGFYRATKDAGIPHDEFSHGLQDFRDNSGPLIRQADFDAKVWCESPRPTRPELARDNPVYPTVITPAARSRRARSGWLGQGRRMKFLPPDLG